mmetsp:Transcript_8589/g.23980  ORF Transcript_8589/g.23980 Transcript_8589/m.23980 type:complete len:321 (+) Transcript_8589:567-1529(+)
MRDAREAAGKRGSAIAAGRRLGSRPRRGTGSREQHGALRRRRGRLRRVVRSVGSVRRRWGGGHFCSRRLCFEDGAGPWRRHLHSRRLALAPAAPPGGGRRRPWRSGLSGSAAAGVGAGRGATEPTASGGQRAAAPGLRRADPSGPSPRRSCVVPRPHVQRRGQPGMARDQETRAVGVFTRQPADKGLSDGQHGQGSLAGLGGQGGARPLLQPRRRVQHGQALHVSDGLGGCPGRQLARRHRGSRRRWCWFRVTRFGDALPVTDGAARYAVAIGPRFWLAPLRDLGAAEPSASPARRCASVWPAGHVFYFAGRWFGAAGGI